MLAMRRDKRRYLARARDKGGCGNQSGDRVDSAHGLDRSGRPVCPGGRVFSDCVPHCSDRALRYRPWAIDLVSNADAVIDFQQSDPAAPGPDLLWTVSMAAIVRGQSRRKLGRAPKVPDKRIRSGRHR